MKNLQDLLMNQIGENLKNKTKVWSSKTLGEYKVSELNEEERESLHEVASYEIGVTQRVFDISINNNSIEILM